MASKRELDRLEDENRTLCQRLSNVEFDLKRKDDALKASNLRKTELLNDLRDYQHKVKELKVSLERAEEGELEAKGVTHDCRQQLEVLETQLRDQAASSKSAIASLQLEIKAFKTKLAQNEEKCYSLEDQLQMKDETIRSLQEAANKRGSSESSRLANLNQALMQAKQLSTQLAEENDALKSHEQDLIRKLEKVEQELLEKSNELSASKERPVIHVACPGTPIRRGSHPTPTTLAKPLPEVTLIDSLQAENDKLKRDLECIQTNFQLTSQKSQQLKKEKKELEQSVQELQTLFDKVAGEKDDLQVKFEETKTALVNRSGVQLQEKEHMESMTSKLGTLEEELDKLQKQNIKLQEKLQHELTHSLKYQDSIERIDKQAKILKEEKSSMQLKLDETLAKLEKIEDDYSILQNSSQSDSDVSTRIGELKKFHSHQINTLKQEKTEVDRKLQAAAKCIDEAQDQIIALTKTKESLEMKVSALEARNTALLRENKALSRSTNAEVGDLKLKYVELAEQSDDKDTQIHNLEDNLQKLQAKVHDLEKSKSRVSHEASRNWELAIKLQKALEMQETSNFELDEVRKEKVHQCSVLEIEIKQLKNELSAANNLKASLEEKQNELTKKIEGLELNNFELTTKLDGIEFETESAKLSSSEAQEKLSELEERIGSLKSTLVERDAQLSSLKFSNEMLEGENSTLLSQVTSLSEMVASRNEKIDSLQTQLSKYDLEMGEIAETIADLEAKHGSCGKDKQMLEDKIDSLKSSLQEAFNYEKEAERKILSLKLDMKQIQECNNGLEAINTELQEKVQAQYTKIDELNDLQVQSERQIKKLQLEIEIKVDSLQELLGNSEAKALDGRENLEKTKSKLRGILKSSTGRALHPIQNLVD